MKQKEPKDSLMLSLLIFLAQVVGISMFIINVALITMIKQPVPPPLTKEESKPYEDAAKELVAPMVFKLTTPNRSYGTAFTLDVGRRLVTVTNKHACGEGSVGTQIQIGDTLETVIALDKRSDLCFLTASKVLGLQMSSKPPETLDIIFTVGHPSGGPKMIKSGRIWGFNARSGYTTMKTYGGESGSPVLNTKGEVVGVIWGRDIDAEDLGLFVPWHTLKDFIATEIYKMKPQYRK